LRRSFQNDPIYKESLRGFINTLVQRRFHQEFFIEGGRSRSGKLLPPRYGILNYIVDGARRHDIGDVLFVPTAIAYDQILELSEYVRQNQGDEKEAESFLFLVRQIRAARARKLGRIHVRFAEPISLREFLDRSGDDRLVVEKLAFQISNQINAVTPLTPAALACSVLLGAGKRALGETEFIAQAPCSWTTRTSADRAHRRVEAGAESKALASGAAGTRSRSTRAASSRSTT
jgi:glycerol-3-phosphate O-acyltransferase